MHNISSYPHYANIDIVALIDTKIAKNNEIMQQENISLISSQLTSYETRISSLESKRKKSEESEELDSEQEEMEDLDDQMRKKAFHEELEIDTYLYLTFAMSYTSIQWFLGYGKIIFGKNKHTFWQRLHLFFIILFSPVILLPGLATVLIQLYCVYYVYYEALNTFTSSDKTNNVVLKVILLILFVFMVAKEVSQSINCLFFTLNKAQDKKYYIFSGCFLPAVIQALMGFTILYVGFLLILSTDDPINLIQNFASVYVLLEIDNIMMDFIKMSKLSLCINAMDKKLYLMRHELGTILIFKRKEMMQLLVKDSLEIDHSEEPEWFKKLIMVTRTVVLVGLMVFAILVYLYEMNRNTPSQEE